MIKPDFISGKSFWSMRKDEFFALIDKLYKNPNSNASKQVPGVSISIGESKMIVRIDRKEKRLQWAEFTLLSAEYEQDPEEFLQLLIKRKIEIIDAQGVPIAKPKRERRKSTKPRKQRAKGHDGVSEAERQVEAANELLKPESAE